ncbi:MAG: hypothetical protein AAFY41_15985, partial [Bacteroidota bacterium]
TRRMSESLHIRVPEAFTYFKYLMSDYVAIGVGLRKNLLNGENEDYLSKQINLSYNKKDWSFTLGAGGYNKNGFLENSGLPFTSKSIQKSLDVKRSTGDTDIAISFFDKNGEVNQSKYAAKGTEFFVDHRISPSLRASGSVTLLDADSKEGSYVYDLAYFVRGNISWNPAKFWTIESIVVARQGTLTNLVENTTFDESLNVYQPTFSETNFRLDSYINIGLSVSKVIELSDEIGMIAFASLNNVPNRRNVRNFSYNEDYTARSESLFSKRTAYFGVILNY